MNTPQTETSRAPHVQQAYDAWHRLQADLYRDTVPPCPFCGDFANHRVVERGMHMIIVENRFPYQRFDHQQVDKHYLLIPLEHVDRLSDLSIEAHTEYLNLYEAYHETGFSLFTRSVIDTSRSIPLHLHTHLFSYK